MKDSTGMKIVAALCIGTCLAIVALTGTGCTSPQPIPQRQVMTVIYCREVTIDSNGDITTAVDKPSTENRSFDPHFQLSR